MVLLILSLFPLPGTIPYNALNNGAMMTGDVELPAARMTSLVVLNTNDCNPDVIWGGISWNVFLSAATFTTLCGVSS